MNNSNSIKGDRSLELEGINEDIARLDISPFSNRDYSNELMPSVEISGKKSNKEWGLSKRGGGFRVDIAGKGIAEFNEISRGTPDWLDEEDEISWVSFVHRAGRDSKVYGLGERTGYLEKSGRDYEMWNRDPNGFYTHNEDPLYSSTPFYIVDQGTNSNHEFVGLYLHQAERSVFRVKNGNLLDGIGIAVAAPKATIYLMTGSNLKEVVRAYTDLTGKPLLPPKWGIGYHHSKYGVPNNQKEAIELAKRFRDEEIPCDALYFDIQHMDGNRDFTWDEERFSNPEKTLEELHSMDFKTVNIVDPGIKQEEGYEVYDSGKEEDVYVKDEEGDDFAGSVWPGFCVFPDFIRDDVREWWARWNEDLLDQGVDGIWNDMNEPAVFFGKKQLQRMAESVDEGFNGGQHLDYKFKYDLRNMSDRASSEMIHSDDKGRKLDHGQVHNLYGVYEAMATRRAFRDSRPGERPFILTRAGFSGIQKYAAKWTGDNSSTWEHMKMSVQMVLNLGLSGIPFVGPDVGGFDGDAEAELLTRWIQLGSVLPFFRNHSSLDTVSQEPWSFGDEYEEINRKFISFRYRLLPFLYTEFFKTHNSGLPIIRPLFMEFPEDERTFEVSDQFMVGEAILVAPVLERGAEKRLLYLPYGEGGEELVWKDWWTGDYLRSGYHVFDAPLEIMPVFLRQGHGVPMTETVQHTGNSPERLKLYANTGPKNNFDVKIPLYHDDGETDDYEDGKYFFGKFILNQEDQGRNPELEVENDGYEPFWEEVELVD